MPSTSKSWALTLMQHSNPITASTNDFIFLIVVFLYGYTNWENHALPKDDKKACTLRCSTFWLLKFAKCSWIEDKVLNRPFCLRASRFTTSIRSDRADMYQFFRHEIGGKTMGKIMKKNIMVLRTLKYLGNKNNRSYLRDFELPRLEFMRA